MKILIKILKIAFIVVLGVSLSYILTSCKNENPVQTGEISGNMINVLPAVAVSPADYNELQLQNNFGSTEIHKRFAEAYSAVYTSSLKESMVELISITVNDLGADGNNFLECINTIDNIKEKNYLPCIVESAKFNGKDSWIMVFNWGMQGEGIGHIAYCAVEKSTRNVLSYTTCR